MGCSKHCFEVADRTDEVFEEIFEESESVSYTYGKVKLTWYEIFR
ncbi:hypothetical protein [Streptococcus pneumoniae]|nr:hypothetical protein [Streptococcus pneumoniae]